MTSFNHQNFGEILPLEFEPDIIDDLQELTDSKGSAPQAIAEIFDRAGIVINVDGQTDPWSEPGKGALLVGDHRFGIERMLLMSVFGRNIPREDIRFVAKPYSLNARLIGSLGVCATDLTIPVVPTTIASDSPDKVNRDILYRLKHRRALPTKAQIKAFNNQAISKCAQQASEGYAVTIYPTGGVMDATKSPWKRGIGRIIQQISPEAQETVSLVTFRFDNLSKLRFLINLAMRDLKPSLPAQEITMRIGDVGTIRELVGDPSKRTDIEITELLRQSFLKSLGPNE